MESIATDYKKVIFATLLKELDNINHNPECISFMVRDINTEKNNALIAKHYEFLKNHFHLPRSNRQPQKLTSQTMLSMFKGCEYTFNKTTRCYFVDTLRTTSGYYECSCV